MLCADAECMLKGRAGGVNAVATAAAAARTSQCRAAFSSEKRTELLAFFPSTSQSSSTRSLTSIDLPFRTAASEQRSLLAGEPSRLRLTLPPHHLTYRHHHRPPRKVASAHLDSSLLLPQSQGLFSAPVDFSQCAHQPQQVQQALHPPPWWLRRSLWQSPSRTSPPTQSCWMRRLL